MQVQQILDRKGERIVTLSCDLPVLEIAGIMADERIGVTMMVDHGGKLVGIISERDIIRHIARNGGDMVGIPARHLMTTSLVTCTPDTSLEEVLALMSDHIIRHLPVMRDDRVVGLISIRDVLDLQRELFIKDVERRKETEAETRRAKEEAELANRTKTEFLANMSHELKTPLNAIVGFSELLLTGTFGPLGSPQNKGYIDEIHTSGQHLLEIINDILDISRIETGARQPVDSVIDLQHLANSCVRLAAERAKEGGVSLALKIDPSIADLRGDSPMTKQMLMNLLTNAVKFTPAGGKVTVAAVENGDGELSISVSDTGIGIAPENLKTVIEPFHQVDGSLQRKFEGTGLGLALVNAMMGLHDGALDISSTVGEGTTVTLRFPANRKAGSHATNSERLSA